MRKVNFLRIMSEHIYSNSVIRFMKFWETYIQVLCCVVRSLDWTFSSNYMNDLVSICLGNWSKVKLVSFSWFFNVFRSLVTWELKWDIHLPPQNPTVLITLTFINVWVFVIKSKFLDRLYQLVFLWIIGIIFLSHVLAILKAIISFEIRCKNGDSRNVYWSGNNSKDWCGIWIFIEPSFNKNALKC